MANRNRGGIYVGVTADITTRIYRHREGTGSKHVTDFSKLSLVPVERHVEILTAKPASSEGQRWFLARMDGRAIDRSVTDHRR